jgi:hypothetical protein
MIANRTVGTGLTASAVISSWTYTSALLGAPYLMYWYGVALPIWYLFSLALSFDQMHDADCPKLGQWAKRYDLLLRFPSHPSQIEGTERPYTHRAHQSALWSYHTYLVDHTCAAQLLPQLPQHAHRS